MSASLLWYGDKMIRSDRNKHSYWVTECIERDCMKNMRAFVMMSVLSGASCLTGMKVYASESTTLENSVKPQGRLAQFKQGAFETGRVVLHGIIIPCFTGACMQGILTVVVGEQKHERAVHVVAAALGLPAGMKLSRYLEVRIPSLKMSSWGRTIADIGGSVFVLAGMNE